MASTNLRAMIRQATSCVLLLAVQGVRAQSYFQQEVNYRIDVRLDDAKHELHACEQFD